MRFKSTSFCSFAAPPATGRPAGAKEWLVHLQPPAGGLPKEQKSSSAVLELSYTLPLLRLPPLCACARRLDSMTTCSSSRSVVPLLHPPPSALPNSLQASSTKVDLQQQQQQQLAQCGVKQSGRRIQLEKNDITCAMEEGAGVGLEGAG